MHQQRWATAPYDGGTCAVRICDGRVAEVRLLGEPEAPPTPAVPSEQSCPLAQAAIACVLGALALRPSATSLPLALHGTPLQKRVWRALCDIPMGQTRTYAGLAEQLGVANGCRAVANACAANKLAVLVPCHRVVRSDGGLGGYRWGVERKRALLAAEAQTTNGVPEPKPEHAVADPFFAF